MLMGGERTADADPPNAAEVDGYICEILENEFNSVVEGGVALDVRGPLPTHTHTYNFEAHTHSWSLFHTRSRALSHTLTRTHRHHPQHHRIHTLAHPLPSRHRRCETLVGSLSRAALPRHTHTLSRSLFPLLSLSLACGGLDWQAAVRHV
jgi:hypothetical protein